MTTGSLPPRQGLYDPAKEHDACGVGFVATFKGRKSHQIVRQGLSILEKLTQRCSVCAAPKPGDSAPILLQIADTYVPACCTDL